MSVRLQALLRQMDAAGAVRIGRVCHPVELAAEIQSLLEAGKQVLYMPRTRGLRHFYNHVGFIRYFEIVIALLKNAEVVVPPSLVDYRSVFAVRPKMTESNNLEHDAQGSDDVVGEPSR